MEKFDQKSDQKKSGLKDKLGEAIEQVGNKVSDLGSEKVGKRIHDAGDKGDKIETTHKNPAHPVEPQSSQDSKFDREL